jgi:hypothetical protein
MKQAILITAYKNIHHLKEIIDWFDDDFSFYIHIDKKSNLSDEEKRLLEEIKKAAFVSRDFKTNWGGMNHLNSILLLLREASKNGRIEYFHLISGTDFPIKSCSVFKETMLKNKGKEFIEYFEMPAKVWENGGMDRILYYNLHDVINAKSSNRRIISEFVNLQKKINFKRNIADFPKLYGGSTWWSLSAASCQYVLEFIEKNPSFLNRFKYTFCAEEIFFQTIILNSPLKENVVNDNQRYILWENRNGNIPANLDETDIEAIEKSEKLFARRFEYPASEKLVAEIKKRLG